MPNGGNQKEKNVSPNLGLISEQTMEKLTSEEDRREETSHLGRQMAVICQQPPANQRAASSTAAEHCQLAFVNPGYETECEGRRQANSEEIDKGVCFSAEKCDLERVTSAVPSVLDVSKTTGGIKSIPKCHVSCDRLVSAGAPSQPCTDFRSGALRIQRFPDISVSYGSKPRLWFHRHWATTSGEAPRNVYDLHGGQKDAGRAAFPDAELGQDITSPPSWKEESARNQSSEGDRILRKGSSLKPPTVYSIGVFYSDTDQCQKESGLIKDTYNDPRTVEEESSLDLRNGEVFVQPDEQVNELSQLRPDMARSNTTGDTTTNRQNTTGSNNLSLDAPNYSAPENRRRGNSEGSCRGRHDSRRISNSAPAPPQLTPDAFTPTDSGDSIPGHSDTLPDILNSHLPPPYSTLPPTSGDRSGRRLPPPSHPPPPPPGTVLPPCPHSSTPRRGRGAFRGFPPRDRLRSSARRAAFAPAASESDEPKHCCGVMVTQTVSIRWFILMIAFVGLCCAIVGTVLGALKATGREHLTVSLLMIGVGIVLITVSGIAWRLTSHDAPSCRAMLGLQSTEQEPNRRFVPRVPPYGRPHHPYAAMMYPEFQYRPPPPSYQASMQEYRLRLLLLDRQQGTNSNTSSVLSPVSPPPTYRSHTSSTLHSRPPLTLTEREYSRPPSYRSRASSAGVLRPSTETLASSREPNGETSAGVGAPSTSHSRNPSLSLSFLSHESLFVDSSHSRLPDSSGTNAAASDNTNPVHFTSPSGESQNSVVAGLSDDSSPLAAATSAAAVSSPEQPLDFGRVSGSWRRRDRGNNVWALRKNHDVNAVTIVQTTDSSQVLNQDTVILSISGHNVRTPEQTAAGEVQILAHV